MTEPTFRSDMKVELIDFMGGDGCHVRGGLGVIRDDFAGPGGWSQGLRLLNLSDEEVGVEFNKAAVDTARAAGFKRWLVDVTSDAVRNYAWGPIRLYTASPPCPESSGRWAWWASSSRPRLRMRSRCSAVAP